MASVDEVTTFEIGLKPKRSITVLWRVWSKKIRVTANGDQLQEILRLADQPTEIKNLALSLLHRSRKPKFTNGRNDPKASVRGRDIGQSRRNEWRSLDLKEAPDGRHTWKSNLPLYALLCGRDEWVTAFYTSSDPASLDLDSFHKALAGHWHRRQTRDCVMWTNCSGFTPIPRPTAQSV